MWRIIWIYLFVSTLFISALTYVGVKGVNYISKRGLKSIVGEVWNGTPEVIK